MDMQQPKATTPRLPNRLRERRNLLGLTMEQVAERAGTTYQQIEKLEKGYRRLTDKWLLKLSPILECDPADLLGTSLIATKRLQLVGAPIIDWVEAGHFTDPANPYEPGQGTAVVPVQYNRESIYALKVVGNSMNRVAPDGSIIICDYEDTVAVDGKCYIIKINDEVTFKRYRANPCRFEPYSTEEGHETVFNGNTVEIIARAVKTQLDI